MKFIDTNTHVNIYKFEYSLSIQIHTNIHLTALGIIFNFILLLHFIRKLLYYILCSQDKY